MSNLLKDIKDYFGAAGFRIIAEGNDYIVADKMLLAEGRDTRIVWTVPEGYEIVKYETKLEESIEKEQTKYPNASAYIVLPGRSGLSQDIQDFFRKRNITYLAPIQFFDTPFKTEVFRGARSAINDLLSTSSDVLPAEERRVKQPFVTKAALSNEVYGEDLWEELITGLKSATESQVRVILGPAGSGKTVLFKALFASLYTDFIKNKTRYQDSRRPIPLRPSYLFKGAYKPDARVLIGNFKDKEVAAPVNQETFEWLLVKGYAIWLFDALEEVYNDDETFTGYLLELVTRPESKAQIIIWSRDSLLKTSGNLRGIHDEFGTNASIYTLTPWKKPSQRELAWLRLENRRPGKKEKEDPESVDAFLKRVDHSSVIKNLAGIPFYCGVFLEQFREGRLLDPENEMDLLYKALDRMVKREYEKGNIEASWYTENGVEDCLELLAPEYVENHSIGLSVEVIRYYGEYYLAAGLTDDDRNRALNGLVRFPLFCAGSEAGTVSFTHDLIAEALAAKNYVNRIPNHPTNVARKISDVDLGAPSLLRLIASRLDPPGEQAIGNVLTSGVVQGREFTVLLIILMLAQPRRDLFTQYPIKFEDQDLTGVRFLERDLSGISLKGANLTGAEFGRCDLSKTHLEGAIFDGTRFKETTLKDANFGDLRRAFSLYAGSKLLDDPRDIRVWVNTATGLVQHPAGEPCGTVLQLRHLCGKFITPLGKGRREQIAEQALLSGKRFRGAPRVERIIEGMVKSQYLSEPDDRRQYSRARGPKYTEMVELIRDAKLSPSLKELVKSLCPSPNCSHDIPRTSTTA